VVINNSAFALWQVNSGVSLEVRHYVHTQLSPSIDEKVYNMLQTLTYFQERSKKLDQERTKKENAIKSDKKRYCIGFREVERAIHRGKLKGLIVAPNLQENEIIGGLDDKVMNTVEECRNKDLPVIFALSRNRLGRAMGRKVRLNVCGLLSVEGQHIEWKQICQEATILRERWMADQLERNVDLLS